MIKYNLQCNDCTQQFEAWFSNSEDYDNQKKDGLLSCPICESKNIEKALMAPSVKAPTATNPKDALMSIRKYVESNFEDVGDEFVEKAIAIRDGDEKPRDIYGKIDRKGEERLADEEVEYVKIPWVEEDA